MKKWDEWGGWWCVGALMTTKDAYFRWAPAGCTFFPRGSSECTHFVQRMEEAVGKRFGQSLIYADTYK